MITLVRTCLRFRELVSAFIGRELRARYRGSILGGLWMVLQPVVFLAVYYTVFVEILKFKLMADIPADTRAALRPAVRALIDDPARLGPMSALAMFAGLIPWTSLQESIVRSTSTILENGNMIKKVAFPSELLPVYLVGYNLINIVIGYAVFLGASFLAVGLLPSPSLLLVFPAVLALQALFMLGVSYLISSVTVFVRDLMQIVPIAMTVWFFFTPIFYFGLPPDAAKYQAIMDVNPTFHLLRMYRAIFIFQPTSLADFPWNSFLIFGALALVVSFLGFRLFSRVKSRFADEL